VALKLDHVFILTEPDAPIAEELVSAGFIEGTRNPHPGQGSANRRFFFGDFTLEWLFLVDEAEAREGAGQGLKLADRWLTDSASPFALVVRCDTDPDFVHWLYWPDYFDGKMSFAVGENSENISEPLCICMPKELPKRPPPAELNNSDYTSVAVEITLPSEQLLSCNASAKGRELNLAPKAPMKLVW